MHPWREPPQSWGMWGLLYSTPIHCEFTPDESPMTGGLKYLNTARQLIVNLSQPHAIETSPRSGRTETAQ
jgi:hypothetical protein